MTKNLLIVDDDPNIRFNYRVTLETEGFEVYESPSGADALVKLKIFNFDLVILDMHMPEMNGLELLEKIRQDSHRTPVVIVTAYGGIPHAVKAIRLGAIDFLHKPLVPRKLRNVVWEVIARHSESTPPSPEGQFDIHFQCAKQLINLQKFKEAKVHIAKALEIKSDSPDIFNLAGILFEMLEDYVRAQRYYSQALRLDKHYEAAQQNLRRISELSQFGSSKEPFHLGGTPE